MLLVTNKPISGGHKPKVQAAANVLTAETATGKTNSYDEAIVAAPRGNLSVFAVTRKTSPASRFAD